MVYYSISLWDQNQLLKIEEDWNIFETKGSIPSQGANSLRD